MIIAPGSVSQSIDVLIVDDSGLPVPGLVAATFPTVTYSKAGANADVPITLADLATITTAWASGGVKERGSGYYRLDVPDAAFNVDARVTIRGEASGKRVISPPIDVRTAPTAAEVAAALAEQRNIYLYTPALAQVLDLFQGDSYQTADGRGISVTKLATETHWPTTLSTVHFYAKPTTDTLRDYPDAASLEAIECDVETASGSDQEFTLELSAAELATLQAGADDYDYWFKANVGGNAATLRTGRLIVRASFDSD